MRLSLFRPGHGTKLAVRIGNDFYAEENMQSPLAVLMGLASGAVGLMQRVLTHGSPKAGFDEQLNAALAEGPQAGKPLLTKILSEKGTIDEEAMKALVGSPQALLLLQYLSVLKSFGVSSRDAQALLLGKSTEVSDEALKAILSSCGIKEGELTTIMSDQALVSGLKLKLAESFSTPLHQQAPVDALIELSTADQATFDAMVLTFIANKGMPQDAQIQKDMDKENFQLKTTPAEISQKASEIKKTVIAFLKNSEGGIGKVMQDAIMVQGNGTDAPALTQALDTLENTFKIPRQSLRDLFFATDPLIRQTALDEATSKITSFLNANADKPLPKQCTDVLALLKSSLSNEEFAPIEKAIKLLYPDLMVAGTPVTLDRQTFEVLARTFGEEPSSFLDRYTQQILDQIKQTVPGQVKNGERSLTIRLHPPMLGRVDVSIRMDGGALQASFRTDQPFTRDILQQNMYLLKDALAEQGIRVTQVLVSTDVLNSRTPPDAFAWTGSDRGYHNSSQHGRERGTSSAYRDPEEYGYTPAIKYAESGGLDIFA
jgi:flagellar hook-length control protein FliK